MNRQAGEPVPPRWSEALLLRSLSRAGAAGRAIVGDLREEHAARARGESSASADRWYRREAAGIAVRAFADRLRGSGSFFERRRAERVAGRREMMAEPLREIRQAARALLRAPQFAAVSILTLGLAIGANAAVFAVVDSVLLEPLPYPESERLTGLWHAAPGLGYDQFGISPALYFLYAERDDVFEGTSIFRSAPVNLTGEDEAPDRVPAGFVSHTLMTTLGVAPALGRGFTEAEGRPGGADVAILSDELWRTRFGADASVLGRTIRVDGRAHEIVGIMPPGFAFPERDTRIWVPLPFDPATTDGGTFAYDALARLRPGIEPGQAQVQLEGTLPRLRERLSDSPDLIAFLDAGQLTPVVHTLKEEVVGELRRPLWILLGTVGFIFLIACANVTNLFLVRAEARQKEMAVRTALGAGRATNVRHYLAESALLAIVGGVIGAGFASIGVRVLLRIAPPQLPRIGEVGLDAGALLFALIMTCAAAVLLALLPAFRLTSASLLELLGHGRGTAGGRNRQRARRALVVLQTALALVLLAGSGLMVRSFQKLRATDPGFSPDGVLTFRVSLPPSSYADAEAVAAFHQQVVERLRALPGVTHAAGVSDLPLAGQASGTAHVIEDHPRQPGELPPMMWYTTAMDGYFEAMRIPLVAGRGFDDSDHVRGRANVVISESVARRFWPDGNAVGRRLRPSGDTIWRTIIGVAGDVRDKGIDVDPAELVYYPMVGPSQDVVTGGRNMTFVVRARAPETLMPAVRREVWSLDPNLPIAAVATLERILADSMVRHSFTMVALVVASAVALMLGAIGLYGVISYLVAQRTREIGVRMALGAAPGDVSRMVVGQGLRLAGLGLLIGLLGALGLTRLMTGLLFGTSPNDPVTFVAVVGLLAGVALLASWLPARRAALIDPAKSLQAE